MLANFELCYTAIQNVQEPFCDAEGGRSVMRSVNIRVVGEMVGLLQDERSYELFYLADDPY